MEGRSVIIAGASGGLGGALAMAIAARGGIPILGCHRRVDRGEALRQAIQERCGIEAPVVAGDVLAENVRRRLISAAQTAGRLYGLVPLLGDPARVALESASQADLLNSLSVNFVAPVLLARDFAAAVGEADAGIVFISTMQGVAVFANSTVYAAPKAALVHTAKIMAKQWPIRVNVVAPGVNDAGMAAQSVRSGKYNRYLEDGKIPRFGRPEDVARAIVFLLEPDNYITGQVLTVDGGLSVKM
jgi:NAD(P)-dependent dehydrogenase (short-subunit alcohol dehydrogenase family)